MLASNSFWSIDRSIWETWMPRAIAALMAPPMEGSPAEMTLHGNDIEVTTTGRIAMIPIKGVMMKDPGFLTYYGATSTNGIEAAVIEAVHNDEIDTIILRIDSGGGSVSGLASLITTLQMARKAKTLITQVEGYMASAALNAGVQAEQVFANHLDMVGSIGVRIELFDYSAMFEQIGIKAVNIDTGAFKSLGGQGTEITEDHKKYLQSIVDTLFADFVKNVQKGRGITAAKVKESADGRMFFADDAVTRGLIDGVQNMGKTLSRLNPRNRSATRNAQASNDIRFAQQKMLLTPGEGDA